MATRINEEDAEDKKKTLAAEGGCQRVCLESRRKDGRDYFLNNQPAAPLKSIQQTDGSASLNATAARVADIKGKFLAWINPSSIP